MADLGSGSGFPGLPLAIALPSARIDLIESTGRKCDVITRLAEAAHLDNARVIPTRAEQWAAAEGGAAYDAVTARALAPLAILLEYAAPLLRENGTLIAWKGARDTAEESAGERAAEQLGMSTEGVHPVMPFKDAKHRHLHVYKKTARTPPRFPRRPGMAGKRPLA